MNNEIHLLKLSRLEGLTDGVFAIAMTILVLDLKLPSNIIFTNLATFLTVSVLMKLFIYIGSFIILGTLWIAMNFQLGLIERINRFYLWANVFYLMIICVVPFSASLIGSYPQVPACIIFYAVNLLLASFGQAVVSQCAHVFNLNKPDLYTPALRFAILRRITVAPIFYFVAIFLSFINTNIAFIALVAPTLIYLKPGRVDKFD